jgi:hypothetical protein
MAKWCTISGLKKKARTSSKMGLRAFGQRPTHNLWARIPQPPGLAKASLTA